MGLICRSSGPFRVRRACSRISRRSLRLFRSSRGLSGGEREGERVRRGSRRRTDHTGVTDLVAPNLLSYVVEGLYYPQTELLPLLVLVDDDVFDVAHQAEIMYAVSREEKNESMNESAQTHQNMRKSSNK